MAEPQIVQPPQSIFKAQDVRKRVVPSQTVIADFTMYQFQRADFPEKGGILIWFEDCPFPAKGFPTPQAIYACNISKRFFKRGMDALMSKNMTFPLLGFLLSPKKSVIIEKWLDAYSDSSMMVLNPHLLESSRFTECAGEIRKFIVNFLVGVGIQKESAEKFAEVFSTLIQYDDAYRLRIEDVMSETTKEKMLKHPTQEIEYIIGILEKREPNGNRNEGLVEKFNNIAKGVKYLFFIPKYKKAFMNALQQSHFKNFQYDDADRFHVMLRSDYDYMGYKIGDRVEMYKGWFEALKLPMPPRIIIKA